MTPVGFPHSDICGSTPACDSPQLFAANHVLHRLLTPRHSPCALSSLTTNFLWAPGRALVPSRSDPRICRRTVIRDPLHRTRQAEACFVQAHDLRQRHYSFNLATRRLTERETLVRGLRTSRARTQQGRARFVHMMTLTLSSCCHRGERRRDRSSTNELLLNSNDACFSQDTLSRRRFYSIIKDHGSARPSTKDRTSSDASGLSSSFDGSHSCSPVERKGIEPLTPGLQSRCSPI